jgi:hypothetical protein
VILSKLAELGTADHVDLALRPGRPGGVEGTREFVGSPGVMLIPLAVWSKSGLFQLQDAARRVVRALLSASKVELTSGWLVVELLEMVWGAVLPMSTVLPWWPCSVAA